MARLENKPARGLPPPPAPTRRNANPWKFSETGRKREAPTGPPPSLQDILDDLQASGDPHMSPHKAQPQAAPAPQTAPAPSAASAFVAPKAAKRSVGGIWPLFILLIAVGIIIKVVSQATETGEWRAAIAPIVAILFIAHGWWRMRQRRDQKDGQQSDEKD